MQVSGVVNDRETKRELMLRFESTESSGTYQNIDSNSPPVDVFDGAKLVQMAADGDFVGTFTAQMRANQGVPSPQPVLWTLGPIEQQRGHQEFPFLYEGNDSMTVSGRHINPQANVVIDGRRAKATINVGIDTVEIELKQLPNVGMHMLQVQNPDGQFSNDFIFHVVKDRSAAKQMRQQIQRERTDPRIGLVRAAAKNNLREVKFLVNQGTNVNARHPKKGGTALSSAALHGNLEVAKFLIKNGANVNRSNRDGNSPLHVAAFLCRHDVVNLLLDHGADLKVKNRRQESPIDVVSAEWSEGLADFYQAIARDAGIELNLKQIENDRRQLAKTLSESVPTAGK